MFGWIASRGAALGASLLLHLLILLFGYYLQKNNPLSELIPLPKELPQKKEFEWAATEAAQSQFGAPVEFQSIPDSTELKEEESLEKEQPEVIEAMNSVEDIQEKAADTIEKKVHELTEDVSIATTSPEKTIQKTKVKKEKTSKLQKQMQRTTQATPNRKPVIPEQKTLTLAQLANGFLDHVKTNGTDTITTYGKKGIVPTDEQLKHQRYAEKIAWCLQQSFKQNHARLTDYHHCVVEVFLALNKNGTINQVSIAKSSGKPRVDQFVLYTFQDAQSAFPPVPSYFKEDPYKIVYVIQVDSMMRY